jgi:hypothetical protein
LILLDVKELLGRIGAALEPLHEVREFVPEPRDQY